MAADEGSGVDHRVNRYKNQIIFCWWLAMAVTATASLLPDMGPPTTPLFGIGMDKFIHLATYLVLATVPALFFSRGKAVVRSVILVAVLSAGIEIAQEFTPGRLFSMGDVMANILGVFLGVVIGLYCRRFGLVYLR